MIRRFVYRLKDYWDNSLIGIVMKDPEGELLSESYKKKMKKRLGLHKTDFDRRRLSRIERGVLQKPRKQ